MDNQTLRDRFRVQLTNTHAITVLTVSVFEIIGYIVLVLSGVEYFSVRNHYLWYGVVIPIAVNAATHLIARKIVNDPAVSRRHKNGSIIIAALVTSFVVAVIHKAYIVTSCAFIFPMILSSVFNEKKLLIVSFLSSVFILISVGVAFWLDRAMTLTVSLNLFILSGFSLISFLCGIISINFSNQSYSTIESQAAENDKLLQDVLRDQMTGLYNHNSFLTRLEEQIGSCPETGGFCVAMLDVDNFKQINDTYGHDCGDVVLTTLAGTVKQLCPPEATAYRYGGEEFAVLFPRQSPEEAAAAVEQMLEAFRSRQYPFTDRPITFSAGVVAYTPGTTAEALFTLADQTLYQAKKSGKNRVLTEK